jgi:hypothetical protein
MARSHHRKKHKQHLQQFKQSQENAAITNKKGKASGTFCVAGMVLGLAIAYFASTGAYLWMGVGLVAGGLGGYLLGRRIDKGAI